MSGLHKLPTYLIFALCVYAIVDLAKWSETLFVNPEAIWLQAARGLLVGAAFVWVGRRLSLFTGWA